MIVPEQAVLSEPISIADAAGDEFEATAREHARHVYKVAYSVLRNHHDAEDAAQETFLRFLKHRKHWAEIRNSRAWLARTAWRVALDRRRRDPELAIEDAEEKVAQLRMQGKNAEEIATQTEMRALLAHLIATLPRDLRDVLGLDRGGNDFHRDLRGLGNSRRLCPHAFDAGAGSFEGKAYSPAGAETWTLMSGITLSKICWMRR